MTKISYMLAAVIIALTVNLSAQTDGPPHRRGHGMGPGPGSERLERYRKIRLIEALNLKEEEAVRFSAKMNTHESAMREINKELMDIIDALERSISDKPADKEIQKLFENLDQQQQKMFAERRRFHSELRSLLTSEQMARFYVFERNFNRELREAMDDLRREKRRGD